MPGQFGEIELTAKFDVAELHAQLDAGADATVAASKAMENGFTGLQSVSAAAFARIGEDVKSMASSVTTETARASVAMTAFKKSQDEVRAASILVKQATGEQLPQALAFQAAAMNKSAVLARELAAAEEEAGVGAAALASEANEAKGALSLMGDELGVKINRHMKGFIADLPVVGSLLNSAFSAFAVIGLLEILDRIPEAIDKIVEKLSGWDAAAKEVYAHQQKLSEEQEKFLEKIAVEQAHFSEIGLQGVKKTQEEIKNNSKEIAIYTKGLEAAAAKELELAKLLDGTHLETERVGIGRGMTEKRTVEVANTAGMDDKAIAAKREEWKAATEEVNKYKETIKHLNDVDIKKLELGLGPEQVTEAEKAEQKIQQLDNKSFEMQKKNLEAIKGAADQVSKSRQSAAERDLELTIKDGEAKQAAGQKEIDVNNLMIDGIVQHAKAEYDIKKEGLDLQVAERKISAQRELEILRDEETQIYLLERNKLVNLLNIAKGEAKEEQKIKNQLQALDDQHTLHQLQNAKKVGDAQKKAAQDSLLKWKGFFDQVNQNFQTSINGWLQGTQTFGEAMQKMWQGVAAAIIEKLMEVALKYIEYEILMKVFKIESEKAKAMVGIKSSAAQAGAAGVASFAGAPWPIDMGAPAFGTAMATAASAYSAVGIAQKGALLDRDRPIFGHAEELILPSNISRGLRGMIESGSAPGASAGTGFNFAPVFNASAMDARGLEPLLKKFQKQLFRDVKGQIKNGRFSLSTG